MLPPLLIIFDASFATSVNEKHEINMLLKKFSLVVFKYSPDNSDLSEKATACTTKSIWPHFDFIFSKSFLVGIIMPIEFFTPFVNQSLLFLSFVIATFLPLLVFKVKKF